MEEVGSALALQNAGSSSLDSPSPARKSLHICATVRSRAHGSFPFPMSLISRVNHLIALNDPYSREMHGNELVPLMAWPPSNDSSALHPRSASIISQDGITVARSSSGALGI